MTHARYLDRAPSSGGFGALQGVSGPWASSMIDEAKSGQLRLTIPRGVGLGAYAAYTIATLSLWGACVDWDDMSLPVQPGRS